MPCAQLTVSCFLDRTNISLKLEQCPEDLFQSLIAFIDDNLLTTSSGITHHGEIPGADEELSPSLKNFVVFAWLRLLHPSQAQFWARPNFFKDKGWAKRKFHYDWGWVIV